VLITTYQEIKMISALGHCEDPACLQSSSNHELVRLFRCSIHCDRLLCLFHLNAHNVYYEEEKKQNDAVLNELQNNLTLYQTIFEQQIQEYRELVHQASTLLLHNTSSIIPIEQIRPVLEKLQRAIAVFQQEKVIIKSESSFDATEFVIEKVDSNLLKDNPPIKKEKNTPEKNRVESRRVVVRLERIDYNKEIDHGLDDEQINKSTESPSNTSDEDTSHILRQRKLTDENQQQDNKRSRTLSPVFSGKKKMKKLSH